ncbi:MAG: hypothetical protein OCD02_08670 [Spirochaetaceae bacterium]
MAIKKGTTILLGNELIIEVIDSKKLDFLEYLEKGNSFKIDFSEIKKIDIIGLQFIISFYKEVTKAGKKIKFSGVFTDEFIEELNSIIFTLDRINNTNDLSNLIKEVI